MVQKSPRGTAIICTALVIGTLAIYWQVGGFEFTNYDDPVFITENPMVQRGLTQEGLVYAFTRTISCNWHPLTTLSHMADAQIFGLRAGGHHLMNVALHIANALLLFLVLRRMTRQEWRSAAVAALFAWHPLHVESVAWVAERKDMLSGLFFMLTLWAYARYAERPGAGRYLPVFLLFGLGLMCKPMLVTLPFVLLLLDYWPLGRLPREPAAPAGRKGGGHAARPSTRQRIGRLVLEKVPLLALAAASSIATFVIQKQAGAMRALEGVAFPDRLANAAVSYGRYIGKMLVPVDLAVVYPHPGHWGVWPLLSAVLLLAAVSLVVLLLAGRQPWLPVGWLWFLGTLVPVIGLVQVGAQAMADRYSYLPLIGVFIALVWGAGGLAAGRPGWQQGMSLVMGAWIAVCMVISWNQTRYWQESVTLFRHALASTTANPDAHNSLGNALKDRGQVEEAILNYLEAIRLNPSYAAPYNNLGTVRFRRGEVEEARKCLETAVRLDPNEFHSHDNLAQVLWVEGGTREALEHWATALRIRPDSPLVLNNLAWILATHPQPKYRDGGEALRLARRGCELTGYKEAYLLGTLAAAHAELGQFKEAVEVEQAALEAAIAEGKANVVTEHRQLLALYQQGKPFRDERMTNQNQGAVEQK